MLTFRWGDARFMSSAVRPQIDSQTYLHVVFDDDDPDETQGSTMASHSSLVVAWRALDPVDPIVEQLESLQGNQIARVVEAAVALVQERMLSDEASGDWPRADGLLYDDAHLVADGSSGLVIETRREVLASLAAEYRALSEGAAKADPAHRIDDDTELYPI